MEVLELHYNYVIAGSVGYYLVGYHDIIDLPCVSYHDGYYDGFEGKLQKQLVRWNFSRKVNKYIHTPFSRYVYPRLYPHRFTGEKPLCYIFFGNVQYVYQTSYLDYLRRHLPGVKIVLYLQDLVHRNRDLHLEQCAKKFDLLVSYDQGDAQKYGMLYHPTPMSMVDISENQDIPYSDVYFCGYAKNRYDCIHEVYRKCRRANLICDFNVLGLPADAPRMDGIHYIDKPFDYMTNLQHVKKTRCVVEIMQAGADGFTPRLWESIVYDKHLLTNNRLIQESPYYYPIGCHHIDTLGKDGFRREIETDVNYPSALKKKLSPEHLLQYIDQKLIENR